MKPPGKSVSGRGAEWNLAKDVYKLKEEPQDTFYPLAEDWVVPSPSSKKPEVRQVATVSGASMHMLSKKDLSSGELDTLKRSRPPMTLVRANEEVKTNEEAQVCVHDLHIFVTVQLVEDTPLPYCPLASFAKSAVTPVCGPAVASHDQKREADLLQKRELRPF